MTKIINKPSITEWLQKLNLRRAHRLIKEDNTKSSRLEVLHQLIGLPFDLVKKMSVQDIVHNNPIFQEYLEHHGNDRCAVRIIPIVPELPKYRLKGHTVKKSIDLILKLNLIPDYYTAEIIPRSEHISASSIFIISKDNIIGEVLNDRLAFLSDGDGTKEPVYFFYNFKNWVFSKRDSRLENFVKKAVNYLHVRDDKIKKIIQQKINTKFTKDNYLQGYFEFMVWPGNEIKFFDFNRLQINDKIPFSKPSLKPAKENGNILRGISANKGIVTGRVKVIKDPNKETIKDGEILVCKSLSINHLPLLKKSSAVVTEWGNILSHQALICREMGKPYLVRVKNATKFLKNGTKIHLDADKGTLHIIN